MAKIADLTVSGSSDNEYTFGVYSYQENWREVAAVYIVSSRTENSEGKGIHDYIYVGETDNLDERFGDHHKKSCFENYDANCINVYLESEEDKRLRIESDILENHNFPCND